MEQVNIDGEKRFYAFDNIRYFIVLLVVVIHAAGSYSIYSPWWAVNDQNFIAANYVMFVLDIFIMPAMFFISGYVVFISLKNKSPMKFLGNKFIRLGVPWVVGVAFIGPIAKYIYNLSRGYNADFIMHLKKHFAQFVNLYTGEIGAFVGFNQKHYWYISVLMVFTLLYSASKKVFKDKVERETRKRSSRYILLLILLTAIITAIFTTILNVNFIVFPGREPWVNVVSIIQFQPTRIAIYIVCFIFGIYAFKDGWLTKNIIPGHPLLWFIVSVVLVLVTMVLQRVNVEKSCSDIVIMASFSFVRVFAVYSIIFTLLNTGYRYWNRDSKINNALSRNSYSIYLIHMVVVYLLQLGFLQVDISPVIKFFCVVILGVSISYVVSEYGLRRIFKFL